LAKVDDLLQQAGTSKSKLLTANIWLKDIGKDFQAMNDVWNKWLDPENKPVRATVQAEMARPNILVEIQVTAALPE
jgi:enamine deaminase RidA (YjgF/YER057c/UK114 family)